MFKLIFECSIVWVKRKKIREYRGRSKYNKREKKSTRKRANEMAESRQINQTGLLIEVYSDEAIRNNWITR